MQTGRKVTAIALALALLLLQAQMALATDSAASTTAQGEEWSFLSTTPHDEDFAAALDAGREMRSVISAYWHGLPLLDEKTNGLIASLLDSIQVCTNTAKLNGGDTYSITEIMMRGSSALRMEEAVIGGQYYLNSPQFSPITLSGTEDMLLLYQNILGYLSDAGVLEMDMDSQAVFTNSLAANQLGDMEELAETLALEPLAEALAAWFSAIAEGAPYDGDIASVFGVEATSAMLYQVTKADVISLIETVVPLLQENTALWRYILENADTGTFDGAEGEQMTVDEMVAVLQSELNAEMFVQLADEIPDNITLYYAECYNANGDVVTNIVNLAIPGENDGANPFEIYVEWLPDCSQFYASFLDEYSDGFTVDVTKGAADAEGMTDRLTAVFSVLSSNETIAQFVADASWGTAATETGTETNGSLLLGIVDSYSGEEMGVRFDLYEVKELLDVDVSAYSTLDFSLVMSGAEMPFLSVSCLTETGEPNGMPFDPANPLEGVAFVNPAEMEREAFAEWLDQSVIPAALQTGLSMLSLLPQDVFAWLMTESGALPGA